MKTTSVMQILSGLSGRLSEGASDFTIPQGGSCEARGGAGRVVFNLQIALVPHGSRRSAFILAEEREFSGFAEP